MVYFVYFGGVVVLGLFVHHGFCLCLVYYANVSPTLCVKVYWEQSIGWMYLTYARHHDLLLIRNHNWILIIHKDRNFWKNLLENKEMVFKKGVKSYFFLKRVTWPALGSGKIWILVPDLSRFKPSKPNAGHLTRKIGPLYFKTYTSRGL